MRDGKIVGNETMRPLLKRLPKAEAARYRAKLETALRRAPERPFRACREGQFALAV